jgi:hypothetical protein
MFYHSVDVANFLNKELNSSDFYDTPISDRLLIMDMVVDKLNKKENFSFRYVIREIFRDDFVGGVITIPTINLKIIILKLNYQFNNYWHIIKDFKNEK